VISNGGTESGLQEKKIIQKRLNRARMMANSASSLLSGIVLIKCLRNCVKRRENVGREEREFGGGSVS